MRLPRSLRARLVTGALVWTVLAGVLGSWALSNAFRTTAQDAFDSRLTSLVAILIGLTEINANGEVTIARSIGDPQFERIYSGWYWLVKSGETTPLRSRSLWDIELNIPSLAVSATPTLWSTEDSLGRELRVAGQTVSLPGAARPLTFVVTGDLDAFRQESQRFDLILWLSLAGLGLGLILAILIQVSFGLRPLNRLAHETEAVRTGASKQLTPTGTRELDMLVDEVNSLIEHNRQVIERSRASASDLAHALKTPLAIMQSSQEDSAPSSEQRDQIATMERIITRHLARAATAGPGRHTPVALAPIVSDLARGLTRVYAERKLTFGSDLSAELSYPADREDLEEIVGNLLENAFKWARSRIQVNASRHPQHFLLAVEDDGPGIDSDDASRAIERGARLDEQTPGTGLGLSIVKDIAAIYRGDLRLSRSDIGGLKAEVMLPIKPLS